MIKGIFITVEGIEGSGKSTIVDFIAQHLQSAGLKPVLTREPGGTKIAESIRQILLKKNEETMSSQTELFLIFAARAQNIAQTILPALENGHWVLSDRFTDASFAYQGGGRGIPLNQIHELTNWVQGDLEPDLTILLDLPLDVAFSRIKTRGAQDRIESEVISFFESVRQYYLIHAAKYSKRFRVIQTDQKLEKVKHDVLSILQPFLEKVKM